MSVHCHINWLRNVINALLYRQIRAFFKDFLVKGLTTKMHFTKTSKKAKKVPKPFSGGTNIELEGGGALVPPIYMLVCPSI